MRRVFSLCAFAMVAVAATVATDARACSLAFGPHIDTNEVPADGAIVVRMYCAGSCVGSEMSLEVISALGAPVAGTAMSTALGDDDYVVAWVPDVPFREGESYTVRADAEGNPAEFTVDIVSAHGDRSPMEAVVLGLSSGHDDVGVEFCCSDGASCFDDCIGAEVQVVLHLHAAWSWAYDGTRHRDTSAASPQFLFRIVDGEGRSERSWREVINGNFAIIREQQPEYCAQVEALRLADGKVFQSELTCMSHGTLPELEVRPIADNELDEWLSETDCQVTREDVDAVFGDAPPMAGEPASGCAVQPTGGSKNAATWFAWFILAALRVGHAARRRRGPSFHSRSA